ncbi:hypothetical protein V8B97DRAFT_356756 [Scleroderma yunnanense]
MQFIQTVLSYLLWIAQPQASLSSSNSLASRVNDGFCVTCPPSLGEFFLDGKCVEGEVTESLPAGATICSTGTCVYTATGSLYSSATVPNCPQKVSVDSIGCEPC